jgi:hypothetical protein
LSTPENIDASVTGIYARLKNARQYGRDLITHPEALADNGHATNASGRLLAESNNVFGTHFTGTIWQNSYAAINQINLTLEAIPKLTVVPAPTPSRIAGWEGQLYFLRALYYFDLVRVYAYIPGAVVDQQNRGGVPIVLKGFNNLDSAIAFAPSRAPITDVYAQIVSDLRLAEARLTAFGSTTDVSLANKAAAQGLLARVYLYMKDYANAKTWADAAIASAGLRITGVSDYESQWRAATNRETIFQIRFAQNLENIGVNESLQTSYTTLVTPGNSAVLGGFGDLVPRPGLLTDLGITLTPASAANFTGVAAAIQSRSNDVRNRLFETGNGGRTKVWVECTKFIGKNGFINLDNIPLIRAAEFYLIRAEALSAQGNDAAARADLKFLKSRRYEGYSGSALETADDALTGQALFEEILRQRRIEFAFEGHRFFDLKRLGRDIVKTAPSTAVVAFTDARILPPIPQREIDGNPKIQQNFGY